MQESASERGVRRSAAGWISRQAENTKARQTINVTGPREKARFLPAPAAHLAGFRKPHAKTPRRGAGCREPDRQRLASLLRTEQNSALDVLILALSVAVRLQ